MKTILCIDHSESNRLLLQVELAEEGYRVVITDGIEETLSKRGQFVRINGDGY